MSARPADVDAAPAATTAAGPVEPLQAAGFGAFLAYLNAQLQDNGRTYRGYFQPLSVSHPHLSSERADAFRRGLGLPVPSPGWRRAWIVRASTGGIVAHVDLRGHADRYADHRCWLGMGVDSRWRRQGVGLALIRHAQAWAAASGFDWLDLQVLSINTGAVALYRRAGFTTVGEVPDMFRIDGHRFAYTTMTLRTGADLDRAG